jgi:pimeloyl-ACP methyl ester carboxylesterase
MQRLEFRTAAAQASNAQGAPNFIVTRDGVQLFYREWGEGRPILFVAAWGFSSEAWQYQMQPLSNQGFRCIAFDRRSHGRSSDPGKGYDIDTLADDLADVIEQLDLQDVTLVGHSLGGAEAVRCLTRHGADRIARLVLLAPTTPFMPKTADNPDGLDPGMTAVVRAVFAKDFPGTLAANMRPFVVPSTSQALIDWIVAMMTKATLKALLDCNQTVNTTDTRQELPELALPVLVLQGDADVSTPLELTGRRTVALIPGAELKVYEGAPHGLIFTHLEQVNADILAFIQA